MKWTEITVHTTTFGGELVSDLFFDMGASGVVLCDKKDILDTLENTAMWDYYDEKLLEEASEETLVKAFVTQDILTSTLCDLDQRLKELKRREVLEFPLGSLEIITREIDDEDWINIWKKHYRPIVRGNVIICPKWIHRKPEIGQTMVLMDPGMAFGTGEHETTGMCISLMQDFSFTGKEVIDVGCGSGILGITSVKLGAKRVIMADFDPQAVISGKRNAELNGVSQFCDIRRGDLLSGIDLQADFIIANITADILKRLSLEITKNLKRGGGLILSGLIHSRVDEVIECYTAKGFLLQKHIREGEWNAASFILKE